MCRKNVIVCESITELIDHLLNSSICLFFAQLGYFPSKPKSLLISDTSTFKGGGAEFLIVALFISVFLAKVI